MYRCSMYGNNLINEKVLCVSSSSDQESEIAHTKTVSEGFLNKNKDYLLSPSNKVETNVILV